MGEEPLSLRVTRIEARIEHLPVLSDIQRSLAKLEQHSENTVTRTDVHKLISKLKGFIIGLLVTILISLIMQILFSSNSAQDSADFPPRYSDTVLATPKNRASFW